jgi:hypothetical protein
MKWNESVKTKSNKVKPLYDHDCKKCMFLGVLFGKIDVYQCLQIDTNYSSFILRESSDGSVYTSLPIKRQELIDIGRKECSNMSDDRALIFGLVKKLPSVVLNNFQKA